MTEPVLTPAPTRLIEQPSPKSVLARAFESDSDLAVEPAAPGDPNRTRAPADDDVPYRVAAGTMPAHPALPDPPMKDSAAEQVQVTVPATDRANETAPPPPPAARPKLVVLRGVRIGAEFPVYEGRNTVGRFADKPVDIDLVSQESVEQIWCSRQHAVISFDKANVSIEDLNSLNGTWVNGARIHAGQPRALRAGDVIQIGTVQMKLVVG
jgi:hypothetical protein